MLNLSSSFHHRLSDRRERVVSSLISLTERDRKESEMRIGWDHLYDKNNIIFSERSEDKVVRILYSLSTSEGQWREGKDEENIESLPPGGSRGSLHSPLIPPWTQWGRDGLASFFVHPFVTSVASGRREWKERLPHNQWVNGNEGSGCVPHPILPTLRFSRRWWGTRETNHLLHSMEPPVGLLSLRGSEPNLCFHVFHSCRSFFVSLAGEERLRRAKGGGTDPSQEWWTKRMSHEWQWWFFFASFHSSHHNHWA